MFWRTRAKRLLLEGDASSAGGAGGGPLRVLGAINAATVLFWRARCAGETAALAREHGSMGADEMSCSVERDGMNVGDRDRAGSRALSSALMGHGNSNKLYITHQEHAGFFGDHSSSTGYKKCVVCWK